MRITALLTELCRFNPKMAAILNKENENSLGLDGLSM